MRTTASGSGIIPPWPLLRVCCCRLCWQERRAEHTTSRQSPHLNSLARGEGADFKMVRLDNIQHVARAVGGDVHATRVADAVVQNARTPAGPYMLTEPLRGSVAIGRVYIGKLGLLSAYVEIVADRPRHVLPELTAQASDAARDCFAPHVVRDLDRSCNELGGRVP